MFSRKKNRYMFSYEKKRRANLIRRVLITLLIIAAVITALLVILSIYSSKVRVTLAKDRTVEVNTAAKASQFIEEFINGELLEDQAIDTSVLGEQRCTVKISLEGKEQDFTFTVNVIDTEPPVLELSETKINILEGASYDVLSTSNASDNSGEDVSVTIDGDFDPNTPGEQVVKVVATDSSGNSTDQDVTLNVLKITPNMGNISFLTRTGFTAEIKDGFTYIDDHLIVNRSFSVPADYAPGADRETEAAFNKMAAEAGKQGYYLVINRSYRPYSDQAKAYEYFSVGLGEGENTTSSIKPGHSEHQTGLAIDINMSSGYFSDTPEGKWIAANCYKYGFILRYPKGKENITGCAFEPWHVRYVGTELAKILYNEGDWITLEEYYGIPSEYIS